MRRALAAALILSLVAGTSMAQTAPPWQTGTYVYDGAGNIKSMGASEQFRYDALNRLRTGTAGPGHTQSVTYDGFGNIKTMTTDGTLITFGVDPVTNRLTVPGFNVTASYDSAGRVFSGGGSTFVYDGNDTVTTTTVDGVTKIHLYSASDERLASFTMSGVTVVRSEWTLRDASAKVLRRFEKNGSAWSWKEDYIYHGSRLVAAEVDTTARTLHYHPDHLGSPRLITGNGGMKIALHTYFPFGVEATDPNVPNTEAKLKFTGHERDTATLDYMHARYYKPNWGRFLSVDPAWASADMSTPQTWNRYAYVRNNPINRIDPDGRMDGNGMGEPLKWLCPSCSRAEQLDQSNRIAQKTIGLTVIAALVILTRGEAIFSPSGDQSADIRYTEEGETFYRYESDSPDHSRVTPDGGLKPGTFAAPLSDGVVPQADRADTYNLPDPNIPRTNTYEVKPPAGTPVIGPRPVDGGTGTEVIFPNGVPPGSVTPVPDPPKPDPLKER